MSEVTQQITETPELDKIDAVKEQSQAIGEFIDWIRDEKGWDIARLLVKRNWNDFDEDDPEGDELSDRGSLSVNISIEKMLAEFFKIDLQKAEQERRALLDNLRERSDLPTSIKNAVDEVFNQEGESNDE